MNFYLRAQQFVFLGLGLSLLVVSGAQAYQIRGGNAFQVMQSGNPATSASYTVQSTLRIEGRGAVIEDNDGALEDIVITTSGSGAKINTIIDVCDPVTGECVAMFPHGTGENYSAYESCVRSSANTRESCAEAWAVAEGYILESNYLAELPPEVPEEKLIFDLEEGLKEVVIEEDFKTSAPDPVEIEEVVLEAEVPVVIVPEVVPSVPVVTKEAASPVVPSTRTPSIASVSGLKQSFSLDLVSGDLLFPSNDLKPSAPAVLLPREPDSSVEREYFSCFKTPNYVAHNDLWEWLAYRLFFVLVGLVVIIFLLAFWVFLLYRASQKKQKKRSNNK